MPEGMTEIVVSSEHTYKEFTAVPNNHTRCRSKSPAFIERGVTQ